MAYGVQKPSEYDPLDSFNYRQWFNRVYAYIFSRVNVLTVTTTHVVMSDCYFVRADATLAGFTVTLPTAALISGRQITVKKIDSTGNIVTVACTGAETIDGLATKTIATQYISYTFISNGVNWDII